MTAAGSGRCASQSEPHVVSWEMVVIDDREIYECAKLLVEKYGAEAETLATTKIDAAMDKDDFNAAAVWRLVRSAITELLQVKVGPEELLN